MSLSASGEWEDEQQRSKPEDLPFSRKPFTLSGEKQEMYRLLQRFTLLPYSLPKAVTKNFEPL